jgi:hypothetical protein
MTWYLLLVSFVIVRLERCPHRAKGLVPDYIAARVNVQAKGSWARVACDLADNADDQYEVFDVLICGCFNMKLSSHILSLLFARNALAQTPVPVTPHPSNSPLTVGPDLREY